MNLEIIAKKKLIKKLPQEVIIIFNIFSSEIRLVGGCVRDLLLKKTVNDLVKKNLGEKYSAHSLRASFITIAKLNGADDSEVMRQTKHKTSAMIIRYTRLENIKQHNAAMKLGL